VLDRYGHLFPESDAALRDRLDELFVSQDSPVNGQRTSTDTPRRDGLRGSAGSPTATAEPPMKIALLGTGFGQAHAAIYAKREVEGRGVRPDTGQAGGIRQEYGFATTTDLDGLYQDPSIDLIDICLPTSWRRASTCCASCRWR
jgi:hypothetical protein